MPRILHLVKGSDTALAEAVIAAHHASPGTTVTVALLPGVTPPALPAGVRACRVAEELSYPDLLELIFDSDHVITW